MSAPPFHSSGHAPFAWDRYVPVMLTRQGERHALRVTSDLVKDQLSPLFVVHPIDNDPVTAAPVRTIDHHLTKLAAALGNDWGVRPAFVDLKHLGPAARMSDGSTPIEWFVAASANLGLPLAPAISPAHHVDYRNAAIRAAERFGLPVMIRLGPDAWPNLGTPLGDGALLSLITETRRSPDQLHLMIDAEQVGASPNVVAAAMRPAINALPSLVDWASLTVAGTGMPAGTADVGRDSTAELPRTEWDLWQLVGGATSRRPSFGDYCVQNPDPLSAFNPLYMDSSAQLRYTIPSAWFVARGSGVKASGNGQIHDLAQLVVNHRYLSGADFSWGDDWLLHCAARARGPGNQGVWRKVTTNHHLAFVEGQLATLAGR